MSCQWSFTEKSASQFKKLDKIVRKRIVNKLDLWCKYEKPINFAQSLVNSELGSYRFRVGDYRILYHVDDSAKVIVIYRVMPRENIYRD